MTGSALIAGTQRKGLTCWFTKFSLGISLASLWFSSDCASEQAGFEPKRYQLAHSVESEPLVFSSETGTSILVMGRAEESWMYSVINPVADRAVDSRPLPTGVVFYDQCDSTLQAVPGVCVLTHRGVYVLRADLATDHKPMINIETLYRGSPLLGPKPRDFARDINGDGRTDFLLPHAAGWTAVVGLGSQPIHSSLSVPPKMTLGEKNVSYTPRDPIVDDIDGDGLLDISFVVNKDLVSYLQLAGGRFRETGLRTSIAIPLASDIEQLRLSETDQSQLEFEELEEARDFNGDGVLDLLTNRTISSGVFDRRSEYLLYIGTRRDGRVEFTDRPHSIIESEGIQFEPIINDIDGDGALDITTPSTEIGLGRVIGALLSGRISIDVQAYRLDALARFPDAADFESDMRVEFDLSTGFARTPAMRMADFNRDGLADLLLQNNAEELAIHLGDGGSGLFRKKPHTLQQSLPNNGLMVHAVDVTADQRADLLIHYGSTDGAEKSNLLLVLESEMVNEQAENAIDSARP